MLSTRPCTAPAVRQQRQAAAVQAVNAPCFSKAVHVACAPSSSCSAALLARQAGAVQALPVVRSSVRTSAVARPSVFLFSFGGDDDYDEEYTVCKVQLGLFGDIKKWQKEIERASELFDTEDEEGLHYILQEVVMLLLRNIEYVGYGQTAGKVFRDLDEAEQKFNQVTLEERAKFKEETFVNIDGRQRTRRPVTTSGGDNGLDNWLCLTLVVAAEGKFTLPRVNTVQDIKKALTSLASTSPETILAFELLWTPQAEGDSYSKDELLADFPSLATL